jgi:hypothetical protein
MTLFARFMSGQIALWCAFWLVGVPLALIWDVSGLCTVVGCGIQEPTTAGLLLAVFALTSVAIPVVSIAIWRSSTKYPRPTWWQTLAALAAKLCAVFAALLALTGLAVLLYIAAVLLYAAFDHA